MAEYIERDFALDVVKRTSGDYATAFCEIAHHKAADVAPVVHGNWIPEEVKFGISLITNEKVISMKYRCSNCGYETGKQAERFVCCPLCTARMRKED